MFRILLRLTAVCVLVVVGWGSSAAAWDTTAGNDTNYGSITFGGTGTDYGHGVAVDGSGNVYTTGVFAGTVDFGAGNVTSAGSYDVFVTKRNAAGAHQWTTTFGGTGQDYGREVAVDGSGNVYITGYFSNAVDFGAGNVGSSGSYDAFVTKLNAAGAHQWTTTFGSTTVDDGWSVAVDGSGNVYTTGYFHGTVNFGAGNVTAAGNSDAYVTKLNAAGAHQWTTTFGGTSAEYGRRVAVDGSGNVYATGVFMGTVDFGAGDVTSAGSGDVYVTKLNSSGAHQWTTTFGGTGSEQVYGVAVDGSGNVHATGYFESTVNFGAGNVTATQTDAYVTKLNSSGAHQWTTTFGGTSFEVGFGVAVDGSGNVHVTGYFQGTVDFGAGDVTSAGSNDVFVTKLNSSGAHQWTTTFGGTSSDISYGVAVDGSGNVYATGHFENTVDFGAGNVTSAGSYDVFVVKLNSAGQAVVAPGGGGGGAWDTTAGSDTNYGSITFGGTSSDRGFGVAVDGSGNVYTTGSFAGTVNFGSGNVTSNGSLDVFVTKHNSAGAHQWTTTFGGASGDRGRSVAVDGSGNVYITGYFEGTVNFGAGNVTSAGNNDVFVTKLNSSGAHQWTTTYGHNGATNDIGYEVTVDGSGNVYVTGIFAGTVDFGAGDVNSAGNGDVFVTKLNSSGVHQWTTTFGGTSTDGGYGVAVDGSGNVYVSGIFSGTVDFGAGNVTSVGGFDVFVTKLNSSGAHQWTTTFGGTSDDNGYGVAVDGSGNVYVTGNFRNTVNFGAGNVTSAGSYDGFVTKLNTSGAHQWTTTFGGTSSDNGRSVAVDGSGNVYAAGSFESTVDFGAGDVTSAGNGDVFVTKLNSSGAHQWTTTLGGTDSEIGEGVAVDGSGNVHVIGNFWGTADFGAGDVTSAGSYDGFVVKLNSAGQAVVAPGGGGGGGGGGGTPAAPPPPCPWPTATYVTEPGCVEPLKGGISVDADGTLFTVGNLDVTGVTIDLEDGETATDIELVSGGTTTGYVLTSKQRIIGFGDTPATDPDGTDLVTLWPGETVTQLSNNRNGTYFATSHGRVFDTNGNPYVDLSRYVTTNNIVDIKTTDSGSGILIGADGSVFNFGVDLFQGSLGGQGITNIIGGHIVSGGYYLLSASGQIHTFGDIEIAPDITTATTESFNTDTLNAHIIDVTPAGTGLCALGSDGGLFDMLGAQHNTVLRAHTNPNTTAIDTTG